MSTPFQIGYQLTVVSGTRPKGLALQSQPETFLVSDNLIRLWLYDSPGDPDSFDFTLEVVAIDRAGNASPPQRVRIANDPGCSCRVAGGPGSSRRRGAGFALLAGAVLVVRRARRMSAGREIPRDF